MMFLPSNPQLLSLDPLSFVDILDTPTQWDVVTSCISTFRQKANIWQLPGLIEDLVYSIHGKGDIDTRYLANFLVELYPDPLHITPQVVLAAILDCALALPSLFPEHKLLHLDELHRAHVLNPEELKCLIAHQLLGTLTPPKHNTWGCTFLCWYSEPQPLANAINGYLKTVFHFFLFAQFTPRPVSYYFYNRRLLQLDTESYSWRSCSQILFDHLVIEPTSADSVKFPHDTLRCMLIASNKSPGFGSSCTQEELVTGACPALLPFGALLSPTLPDDAVLLAERVRPITAWKGKGRDARMFEYLDIAEDFTFLLLDALELDSKNPSSPLADLEPQNLHRELQKALVGFSALRARNITEIASPLWGTGAFGGDPIVKALVLAMAGARTGVRIWLSIDESHSCGNTDHDSKTIDILRFLQQRCTAMTVGEAWELLMTNEARGIVDGQKLAKLF